MTPYELSILLDVYVGKPIAANPDTAVFIETMRGFMNEGWIRSCASRPYVTTPKLDAFMAFILDLPAPVQEWRMPDLRAPKDQA